MFVEGLGEEHGDAVPEHDRVGHLHHRRLEVQREQHVVRLRLLDLRGKERAERGDVHHGAVDHLAREQGEGGLELRGGAGRVDELDLDLRGGLERRRGLAREEVLLRHVRDARLRPRLRPGLHHLVWVLLGEGLDRDGGAAVGVAFTKDRVDRRAERGGEAGAQRVLLVRFRLFGEVGDVVPLFLQLLDRGLELRDRGADVRQLDDVAFRGLRELAELAEVVGDLLVLTEALGEERDDAAREGDVASLELDAGAAQVGLHDGEEGEGGERGGFVRDGPGDLR